MQESISGAATGGPLAGVAPQNVNSPSAIAISPIAPMTDRAIAAFIDMIVMCAAFPVAGMWAAVQWGGATTSGFELNGLPALFVISSVGFVGFLYLWIGEGIFGATLGKAAMSLRVRSATGGKPGLQKSLLRNLLRIVDGIGVYIVGIVFALTSPTRQRLGDRVAGTVVVRVESAGKIRPVAAIASAVILVASIAVAIGLHATIPAASIADNAASDERGTRHGQHRGLPDYRRCHHLRGDSAPNRLRISNSRRRCRNADSRRLDGR